MMILERDKTGLFQPMATAEQRARNLTRSIEAGQCDPEAGHREIMRATIVAEKIETAQRAGGWRSTVDGERSLGEAG